MVNADNYDADFTEEMGLLDLGEHPDLAPLLDKEVRLKEVDRDENFFILGKGLSNIDDETNNLDINWTLWLYE